MCCSDRLNSPSWLCENAKTLNRHRRSYSSKSALVAQCVSEFNLEVELRSIVLLRVSIFEFLQSQGQSRPGRGDSKSSHVRYAAEGGIRFRVLAVTHRHGGLISAVLLCSSDPVGVPVGSRMNVNERRRSQIIDVKNPEKARAFY